MRKTILIGLDLGTQGVRAIATTENGQVLASAAQRYQTLNAARDPHKEQSAEQWRDASISVLSEVAAQLRGIGGGYDAVLAVDGTSGTFVPLDAGGVPLRTAIMYNDSRASSEVARVHVYMAHLEQKLGYQMGVSFALPKICWMQRNQPELYKKTATFAHQADYIVGCLTDEYRVTDYSNALKTGYDLLEGCWPVDALRALDVEPSRLPQVYAPGQPIAKLSARAVAQTGLPTATQVVAGVTDGYASCVAAGVVRPGQYNSTIGTTLVLKGVTEQFVKDPIGRIYCHKHPEGYWYPGGAGNVGGLCLNQWFGAERFEALNRQVPSLTPTGNLLYPLTTMGERFPFVNAKAEGFALLRNESEAARYAGAMEGVGYVERLCFHTLQSLGCQVGDEITITGGAVKAPVWSQIRANILGKRLLQTEIAEAAFGSAIIAGTTVLGRSLSQSAAAMVRYVKQFEPDARLQERYNELYAQFFAVCIERGYVHEHL